MNAPCPQINPCASNSTPFLNLSSEGIDIPDRLVRSYQHDPTGGIIPPVQRIWHYLACNGTLFSSDTPFNAQQLANFQAISCVITNRNPPPPPLFYNTPQTCCASNSCGDLKCFTVGANGVPGSSVAEANARAHAIACAGAASLVSSSYILVGNDAQSFTASCSAPGQCPQSVTRTVAKDTYQQSTCKGQADADLIKMQLNAEALADATAQAIADLPTCQYGNDEMTASMFCPNNPGLVATVTIPQCKYMSTNQSDVPHLNQLAAYDLQNQLVAKLAALSCPCLPPTVIVNNTPNQTSATLKPTCLQQFLAVDAISGHPISAPNTFNIIPGYGPTDPFDIYSYYFNLGPGCLANRSILLYPASYVGPPIPVSNSHAPCPPCC